MFEGFNKQFIKNSIERSAENPMGRHNIAYLNPAEVTSGGFFPAGVNGEINASAANA